MSHSIEFAPAARDDLIAIWDWIAEVADDDVADTYIDRIEKRIDTLAEYPNRGTPRPRLGKGYRSIPFERKRIIIYRVEQGAVVILRIVAGARDLSRLF